MREGAVRGVSYALSLIFLKHVYGVKWSPWSVTFEIKHLKEGVRVFKYPSSLIFPIKFYLILFLLLIARLWVYSCYKMAVFYRI